jgi:hypothetical protein
MRIQVVRGKASLLRSGGAVFQCWPSVGYPDRFVTLCLCFSNLVAVCYFEIVDDCFLPHHFRIIIEVWTSVDKFGQVSTGQDSL